jgi:ferredoxin
MGELLENRPADARLGVWIDSDLDTGSGIQEEICPEVFMMGRDGIAYTHIGKIIFAQGLEGLVAVPEDCEAKALDAAKHDPGETISLEFVQVGDDGRVSKVWNRTKEIWEPWDAPVAPIFSQPPYSLSRAGLELEMQHTLKRLNQDK